MHKTFHISDVLSIATGRFVSERGIQGVSEIMCHIFDQNVDSMSATGIAMLGDKAKAVILQQFPLLSKLETESLDKALDRANKGQTVETRQILVHAACRLWVQRQVHIYGETFAVEQVGGGIPNLLQQIHYRNEKRF